MKNLFRKAEYKPKYLLCNLEHARFEYEYVESVIDYANGFLKKYLQSYIEVCGYKKEIHKYIYMQKIAINVCLAEIRFFKENGGWRK